MTPTRLQDVLSDAKVKEAAERAAEIVANVYKDTSDDDLCGMEPCMMAMARYINALALNAKEQR